MPLIIPRRVEIKAYDKALTMQGVLVGRDADAESASWTMVHNGIGTGNVTLPVGHPMIPVLMRPGMRLQYRYIDHTDAVVLRMSGPVVADATQWSPRTGSATFTSVSDERLLRDTLAWPVPTAPITSQASAEYDVRTGAVDVVCMDVVVANLITRRGAPVRQVPLIASGQTVTIKARMQPLLDVIRPALEAANFGIRCWQWSPGDAEPFWLTGQLSDPVVLVEIYPCVDRPYCNWAPHSGIDTGSASSTAPTVTRVVVAAGGEGVDRTFAGYIEDTRESEVGPLGVIERLVDARDVDGVDVQTLNQRGFEALAEGAGTTSLDVSTVDGDPWTVGEHYNLGDLVRVTPVEGVTRTEKVRSITIKVSGTDGITIRPQVGDPSPLTDTTAVVMRGLGRQLMHIRHLQARR